MFIPHLSLTLLFADILLVVPVSHCNEPFEATLSGRFCGPSCAMFHIIGSSRPLLASLWQIELVESAVEPIVIEIPLILCSAKWIRTQEDKQEKEKDIVLSLLLYYPWFHPFSVVSIYIRPQPLLQCHFPPCFQLELHVLCRVCTLFNRWILVETQARKFNSQPSLQLNVWCVWALWQLLSYVLFFLVFQVLLGILIYNRTSYILSATLWATGLISVSWRRFTLSKMITCLQLNNYSHLDSPSPNNPREGRVGQWLTSGPKNSVRTLPHRV